MEIKMATDQGRQNAAISQIQNSQASLRAMTGIPGHKRSLHLIEGEAYRRVMSGELPGTLSEFALQLLKWFQRTHPDASSTTPEMIENQIRETWQRRHELIRGG
jgi:hypothetical protein